MFEYSILTGLTYWQIDTSIMLNDRSSKWGSDIDFPSNMKNYIDSLRNNPELRVKASNFLRTVVGDLPKNIFIVMLVFSKHIDVNPIIEKFGGSRLEIKVIDEAIGYFTILSCFMLSGDLKAVKRVKFQRIDGVK